ncbi:MAG: enoyl-CoA hydratase/isomerase family protein [Deltaproteobacteria bacterium]|nr:MAG: enoyl-CoA hydratase/isomerase family protein [Deltaproteobacteria bacterium]
MDDVVVVLRLEGGKANAMTPDLLDTLERMIDGFERGPAAAAVLTGYERYFSGGLALPHIIDFDRVELRGFIELFSRAMTRVFACEKPIVAAINGHAIAGGCVLALMCDWRILVDDPATRIGLNEAQLGIGLSAIVIESLRAAVPPASIVPIALEGTLLAPRDALALGLVHELAPAADLLARATAKARGFASRPSAAVAQVKHALRAPALETVARTAEHEAARWLDTWFSPEAQARLRAAVAKLGGTVAQRGTPSTPPPMDSSPAHSVTQPLPRLGAHTRRDPK